MMRGSILPFAFVLLLPLMAGCSQLKDWALESARTELEAYADGPLKDRVEEFIEEKAGDSFDEWKAEADADQSGDTTWAEWKTWLLGGGGLGMLGWLLKLLRDRISNVAAKDARKRGELWAEIGSLKDRQPPA